MLFIGGILAGIGMFVNSTFGEADKQRTDPKNIENGDEKGNSFFQILSEQNLIEVLVQPEGLANQA